jgi:hypothetical protein
VAFALAAGLASSQNVVQPPPSAAAPAGGSVAAPVPAPAPPEVQAGPSQVEPPRIVAPPSTNLAIEPLPTAAASTPPPKPSEPAGPPRPVRAPTAVLQALDKITAETLRFEAPVGRPIRYKTLVMTVKVCETRGVEDPLPRPAAYLVIDNRPTAVIGRNPTPGKRVYEGWMFANGPALHPVQHPIYDVWLVACSAAAPPT